MTAQRQPQPGEVWRRNKNPNGTWDYTVTVLLVDGTQVGYRTSRGGYDWQEVSDFLLFFDPPKPPLPDAPETVWVDVRPSHVGPFWHYQRTRSGSNSPFVAEYRLVEVHER